jgi:hypothetical protein
VTEKAGKAYRFAMILWGAMLAPIVLYFALTKLIQPEQVDPDSPLNVALLGTATLLVILSRVLRPRIKGDPPGPMAGFIVAFVLSETAGLFGLVTHLITGWPKVWIFFLLGVVGFVLNYPQRSDFGDERAP